FKGGVDVYDGNMNLLFSDNQAGISKTNASGWHLGAYSGTSGRLYLYSQGSDGTFSKKEVKAASPMFSILPLKPYTQPVAAVCNGLKLTVYEY
ncbi:MAG: hypothetical protein J6P34_06070, partial [Paludibacteraceae bacterium]|nr:hypothetical protein [Paludibacteraceae bacterium]